jgi:hypothetical protein
VASPEITCSKTVDAKIRCSWYAGRSWHDSAKERRAEQICPDSSEIDLLSDRESVVDLNPEIPDCAFNPRVTKQGLNNAQVPCAAVEQRSLGATERVCSKQPWIQANAAYPTRDQARILPCRDATVWRASALKQILAELLLFDLDVGIHCFPSRFRQFEPHRMSGFAPGPPSVREEPRRRS